MISYYDMNGEPMESREWMEAIEATDRRVGFKQLWLGMVDVSTVWLGLDHDYTWFSATEPNPHPLIFETMIFVKGCSVWQRRYSTKEEALAGHKAAQRMARLRPWWLLDQYLEYKEIPWHEVVNIVIMPIVFPALGLLLGGFLGHWRSLVSVFFGLLLGMLVGVSWVYLYSTLRQQRERNKQQ
jgi:hypothetical protein